MNDIQIENLLRKAPRIAAPAGLLETLIVDISLPQVKTREQNHFDPRSFFRRWFPAISFVAFLLACVVVVGAQMKWLSQLRSENKTLRAASQNFDELRQKNAEYQKLLAANQELERLRKDALEVTKLRAEVEQLRAQMLELKNLRTENQQLLATNAAQKETEEEDPFAAAKKKAERIACVNNLKQIGLAARLWAGDNNDIFPTDFLSMSNELSTAIILICPSDKARTAAENWSKLGPENISYVMHSPGVSEVDPEVVYVRCSAHNNILFVDGHVDQLGPSYKVVIKNGKLKVERENEPQK